MAVEPLLSAQGLLKAFGGVVAVNRVDFEIQPGEILALIGPNGAGKTTIFNLISGTHRPDQGGIVFKGQSMIGMRPSEVAAQGIVRTFQNLQIFSNMTVLENVLVGCHLQGKAGFLATALSLPGTVAEETRLRARALEFLDVVGMSDMAGLPAESLPFGQQRMVEFARSLAVGPELLLLDEPAAGLTRVEAEELDQLICRIRDQGVTVFLVEHDMNLVMGIADRVIVVQYGTKIAEGTPQEMQANSAVIQAYLGADWQRTQQTEQTELTLESNHA
jgi:branched-chain amino acid transport system ATP-binding protein